MKPDLYREIYKTLNEDLNMILSDDDFVEPEIDLGAHMQNILKKINLQILKKNVAGAIENKDSKGLKVLIENEWDGISKIFVATNKNIQDAVAFSRYALGNNANLNWIDTSNVTDMSRLFAYSLFNGDISGWDVSSVENMESMFYDSEFNGDISGWNVSNVTDMTSMFDECPIREEYKPKFND